MVTVAFLLRVHSYLLTYMVAQGIWFSDVKHSMGATKYMLGRKGKL